MMESKPLRYRQVRSEEGDQGDSHNNIDVAVSVSLPENFQITASLLPDKINALLTSQVRCGGCGHGTEKRAIREKAKHGSLQ